MKKKKNAGNVPIKTCPLKRVHSGHPGTSLVKLSSRMCTMEDFSVVL